MIKKLVQAAIVAVGGLALGGCPLEQAKTSAPANKPPAADYQAAVPAAPPADQLRAICYNDADLAVYRARMLQQELNVATLQCQNRRRQPRLRRPVPRLHRQVPVADVGQRRAACSSSPAASASTSTSS